MVPNSTYLKWGSGRVELHLLKIFSMLLDPEQLSRGLVLVKWWLLAIPHYLVVFFLQGGFEVRWGGLTSVLAIFGAVECYSTASIRTIYFGW